MHNFEKCNLIQDIPQPLTRTEYRQHLQMDRYDEQMERKDKLLDRFESVIATLENKAKKL